MSSVAELVRARLHFKPTALTVNNSSLVAGGGQWPRLCAIVLGLDWYGTVIEEEEWYCV